MSRKEYEIFRLVINILVFAAFLLAFAFVEVKQLRYASIVDSILAALVLSSIFLMLGIMTIMPYYTVYVGRTFIVFSILMALGELYWANRMGLDIFSVIKLALALVLLLYGLELKSRNTKLISLKALAKI